MSQDPIDRLSGFSPSAEGLDRDELLFEAGRASVPPAGRAWALVALLALTQVMTLLLFPAPPAPPAPPPRETPAFEYRVEPRFPKEEPPADDLVPDVPPLRPMDRTTFTTLD